MTSGQEMERVYSYNPGTRTGANLLIESMEMCQLNMDDVAMFICLLPWGLTALSAQIGYIVP